MATLYVRQYTRLAHDENGHPLAAGLEPGKDATLSIAAGSGNVALTAGTKFVRLHTDAICNFALGTDSTTAATTSNARMAANQTEFFGVAPGVGYLAVIAGS